MELELTYKDRVMNFTVSLLSGSIEIATYIFFVKFIIFLCPNYSIIAMSAVYVGFMRFLRSMNKLDQLRMEEIEEELEYEE